MSYRVSPEDIVATFRQRHGEIHPLRKGAIEVRAVANGDMDVLALPMPELEGVDDRLAVANLLIEGLDGAAQRDNSTFPELTSAALKRGQDQSERYAKIRRRAGLGWTEMNKLRLKQGRRCRHLRAYSSSPVMIRPDRKRRIPRWQVRDPLGSYPAATADFDDFEPDDCIFAFQRNLTWLLRNYPDKVAELHVGKKANPGDLFDVLEYVDDEQVTLLVVDRRRDATPTGAGSSTSWRSSGVFSGVGKQITDFGSIDAGSYGSSEIVVLEQMPNRAGRCTVIVPQRITLDRPVGQYDSMMAKFYWQARLTSLELIAIERGIFPSEWVVYPAGGDGKIITVANGRKGIVGEIEGAEYKVTNINPGYKTNEAIDRLERGARHDGKIPSEYGGESGDTNVRTDRRGMSVFGAAVDPDRQEIHLIWESAFESEFSVATDVDKGYFGDSPKSFVINWKGAQGPVDYTPNKHFEVGSALKVKYAAAGADASSLRVGNAQMVGADMKSRQTAMEQDPDIPDVEIEMERIESESIRRAVVAAFQAQAEQGQIPAIDAIRVAELREQGVSLYDAIRQSQQEAQARQAAPVPAGSPDAMPGLSSPGMGAEAGGGGGLPAAPLAPPTLETLLSGLNIPGRPAPAGVVA